MARPPLTRSVRALTRALGVGFTVYFFARGFWWVAQPVTPVLLVWGLVLYLVAMLVMMLAPDDRGGRMPWPVAVFGVLAAAAVPAMASLAWAPQDREAPSATWYIGGMGLFGITCLLRGRPFFGCAALGAFAVSTMTWMEPGRAFHLGLLGAVIWMVAAALIVWMWRRAVADTEQLTKLQQEVAAWQASGQTRRRERRERTRQALEVAGPVLSAIVSSDGVLTADLRQHARLAEGRLRDELRGGGLLNDALRAAIERVRRAGGSVTVLDEGGMAELPFARAEQIRDELAQAIADAGSLRVIIRASRHPHTAVTVVGRRGELDDDDDVELWHEIGREPADAAEKRGGSGLI